MRVFPDRGASATADAGVHVINPLWDPQGGSDWRAVEMYEALNEATRVRLWSPFQPAPVFRDRYPVQTIRPAFGRWPVGGTFIFVGAYFRVGHWFKAALPQRTILVYNTHQPDRFAKTLARLEAWHRTPVEVVHTSPLLRQLSNRPGPVIESPVDLDKFFPRPHARAARSTVEDLYGGRAWRRKLAFFLPPERRRREASFIPSFDPTPSELR